MAGPADAKKLSAKQKSKITRQLRKAVKHNPKVVSKKSFLKKASLVNFKLPVTIRLRGTNAETNPNQANIDLGASLRQREIELGGQLPAEIVFHDSYDGGALGNVDVNILPPNPSNPAPKGLTSTSVPLLWNDQVDATGTSWDGDLLQFLLEHGGFPGDAPSYLASLGHKPGCKDVDNTNADGLGNLPFGKGVLAGAAEVAANTPPGVALGDVIAPPGVPTGSGLPGLPVLDNPTAQNKVGFAPAHIKKGPLEPAVAGAPDNSIHGVKISKIPGDSNRIGGSANPFPQPIPYTSPYSVPTSPTYGNAERTVLRTNALNLTVAKSGTPVRQDTNVNGVAGSQNIVIGKSGGQANLFGNIPGKSYGIDVTVNLATRINSIIRIVDQDAWAPPFVGLPWPAGVFTCSQIWTGGVQNYIPGVRLNGSLKIAPAITSDGHLRIAKASLNSNAFDPARVALAACLAPYQSYNKENSAIDPATSTPYYTHVADPTLAANKDAAAGGNPILGYQALPADSLRLNSAPTADCNADPTFLVKHSALPLSTVDALHGADNLNGYTVTNSGSAVSVAGDLSVKDVEADILVGDIDSTLP